MVLVILDKSTERKVAKRNPSITPIAVFRFVRGNAGNLGGAAGSSKERLSSVVKFDATSSCTFGSP